MSVRMKILAACLGFVAIIALLGVLAQQQAAQMGRLAIGIFDHAFMGMSYVNQAQNEFLRLNNSQQTAGGTGDLRKVLSLLDVALDRAASDNARDAGKKTRGLLAALAEIPASELTERMTQADRSLTKLVQKFAADGLEARDDADEAVGRSTRIVLLQIAVAIGIALGVGFVLGRDLSRPLGQLSRIIGRLAAGDLDLDVPSRLSARRDEIGGVARAAAVFREAMQQNARAGAEREQQHQMAETEKVEALRNAADSIERETTAVAERSSRSGVLLSDRAAGTRRLRGPHAGERRLERPAPAARRCTAARLSPPQGKSSRARRAKSPPRSPSSTAEIASTARAGEQARGIIAALSASMGQIGAVAQLIRDIAGRTNLLALNATIEAARAGEAGRGFAVVAGEVKTLATQTALSTEEIARAVSSVQTATHDAVKVVGEMVGRVAAIERITQTIAAAAEQQTAATGEIARNVLGTAEAMRIVSSQVTSVSQEAQGTGAAVNEMRSVAGEVAEHISELRNVMVRIVRTSSDAANRREDERVSVNLPATLVLNGDPLPAICLDLSFGGARVQSDQPLTAGTAVILRLGGLPDLNGAILRDGQEASIRFPWDAAAAPPALVEWIRGKRAA